MNDLPAGPRGGAAGQAFSREPHPELADAVERIEAADPDAFVTVYEDTRIRRGWTPGPRRK